MVKFVVIGLRRTGTKLITTTLDSHPDIKCYNELFAIGSRFFKTRGFKSPNGYRRYLNASFIRRLRDTFNRRKVITVYLDELFADKAPRATGFKIMYSDHKRIPEVLAYMKNQDARVVHVIRRNVLKTMVSRAVKKVTQVAHSSQPMQRVKISLPEAKVVRRLEKIDEANELWLNEVRGMPYIRVYYEDMVTNQPAEVKRMLEFLEVDSEAELKSPLVKGNSDRLRDVIENYDAVALALKGTKYEWCLDTDQEN